MLFTTLSFFIFFGIVLALYYVLPKKWQWVILLLASFVFYASFSWKFLFFIIFTICTVWGAGKWIESISKKTKQAIEENPEIEKEEKKVLKEKAKKHKKLIIAFTIIVNIGILAFLKYANFFISNFQGLLSLFGVNQEPLVLNLILPLGISFYSFQAVGYLIDVYWGKIEAENNIFRFALFISFFPQIIQGPISRYSELGPQFKEQKKFDLDRIMRGIMLILFGLVKKLIIADFLANIVNSGFSKVLGLNNIQALITILSYLVQDYMDFSGCIDIAMGVAECFGIDLPQNFERPYFSFTIAEYWRRWHITLGTWFKDYIFYPISISKFSIKLGKGAKKLFKDSWFAKQIPAIFGLLVVWLTTGLWHGASWNYVLWGLYYGILIIASIVFKPLFTKIIEKLKINVNKWHYKTFQWIRTIILLCLGRIIFRCESVADIGNFISALFNITFKITPSMFDLFRVDSNWVPMAVAFGVVFIIDLLKEIKHIDFRKLLVEKSYIATSAAIIIMMFAVILFGSYGPGYAVQDFIYMQF